MSLPAIFVSFSSGHGHADNLSSSSFFSDFSNFFIDLPSRSLARFRWLAGLLLREVESNQVISISSGYTPGGGAHIAHMANPPPTFPLYPGPWSFFASGYAVSLFAMALLLNRIQNIVVPSRRSLQYLTRSSPDLRSHWTLLRLISPSIFPMDMSSTYSRTVLRLPTMYYILKSLVLWSIIFLQASDRFPLSLWKPLQFLDNWAASKEMDEVCWSTFLAICGALCAGALTRALEGVGTTNASPFNLFGYAFMLHFYSSPSTHTVKPEGLPSRPDVNVIFTIFVPLIQLSMIHFIGAKQSWSNQRLIPTTICSALTLIHFHSVLWFSPSSYPLLNYVSCIFDSLLLLVILVAFSLNILAQLLLEGSITRLFIGHASSLMPKWDEDFSIVLLRLGIASLEATSVAGLGNEVSGISLTDHTETVKHQVRYGEVEMNRAGVLSITHTVEGQEGCRTQKKGFANDIRHVKVGTSSQGDPMVDVTWLMEFRRFGYSFARFTMGCWRILGRILRGQTGFFRSSAASGGQAQRFNAPSHGTSQDGESGTSNLNQQDIYERFLSGEVVSDDDEDFLPSGDSAPQYDDDDDDDGTGSDAPDDEADTFALYNDLSAVTTSTTTATLLLAHMTDTSSSPLTRRRYRNLVSGQHGIVDREQRAWEVFVNDKRGKMRRQDASVNESRRNCVICTIEERQIICWPCRCLALCDDCRQNLASRLSASKHTCPCCRQPVEGFSRIYIP